MLRAGVFAALGIVAVMATYGMAIPADEKTPDIKTIMDKSFKNKDSYKATLTTDAKGEKWEDAEKVSKEFAEMGVALTKNKPPKGDDKSWEMFSKKFAENTKAVHEAAEKKDAKALKTALGAFDCMGCHKAHR
jgi:cytochrome c556